jgi:hypothetical protein
MSQQSEQQTTVTRQRGNRGHAWSTREDKQFCRSWFDTSVNPVNGRDVRASTFWKNIRANFFENLPDGVSRSSDGL